MLEFTWWTVTSLFVLVLLQHETAVVLWVRILAPYFTYWMSGYLAAFVVVSICDLFWVYLQFLFFRNSFHWLARFKWVHRMDERLSHRAWYQKLRSYFAKKETPAEVVIHTSDSRFKTFVKQYGYIGIVLCGVLPGPAFKEIGIAMALTPKYKAVGFQLIFLAAMLKTIGTMAVYGGLNSAIEIMIRKWFN